MADRASLRRVGRWLILPVRLAAAGLYYGAWWLCSAIIYLTERKYGIPGN